MFIVAENTGSVNIYMYKYIACGSFDWKVQLHRRCDNQNVTTAKTDARQSDPYKSIS